MPMTPVHTLTRWTLLFLAALSLSSQAQQAGTLYDPEPPADSGYVRIVLVNPEKLVDVVVDGKPRVSKLASGVPSDYLVLKAGRHTIALHSPGQSSVVATTMFDVPQGKATTVAFPALGNDVKPIFFDDKANTNKLKAVLALYHLAPKTGPVDVLTADGNTKVFSGVLPGAPASLQVNPVSIELIAVKPGEKTPLTKTRITLTQGGTYSVFLFPGVSGKLVSLSGENKTERYAGNR